MDSEKATETTPTTINDCSKLVLTKKYLDIDEMEEDNNKEIYFDKQYDKTYYDLLDDTKKYISDKDMPMTEKVKLIAEKLQKNIGVSYDDAVIEATALLEKKKTCSRRTILCYCS